MQGNDGTGRGRLAESDIGDGSASAQNANPSLPAPREARDALHDVAAVGDFHHVGSESVCAVAGYDDGRLGLVFGPGGSSSGSSVDLSFSAEFFASFNAGGGGRCVFVAIAFLATL